MLPYFILIEGIDGSGKDTLANYLKEAIYEHFRYDPSSTLSIVGQPSYRFDESGEVRKFIEEGIVSLPYAEMVEKLSANRRLHEQYLSKYKGIILCIRGLLTDLATLANRFGREHKGNLGQKIQIDELIILDTSPEVARQRIVERAIPTTWRESLEHLNFFRDYYIHHSDHLKVTKKRVLQNLTHQEMRDTAHEITEQLSMKANLEEEE
ncbi:AAA family ATPase [Heliobacterium chlorum]|uniref:AAA family ATPase n=1 Tax=Heliobacterium chlorum TaxID=2698 RepID=A0ABR7T1V2_HELCL|nr:AAA family ATPase [Heliobacterium chlorum]MBC9784305.1 AAA family ATPase [Heliobacterium chlorum]